MLLDSLFQKHSSTKFSKNPTRYVYDSYGFLRVILIKFIFSPLMCSTRDVVHTILYHIKNNEVCVCVCVFVHYEIPRRLVDRGLNVGYYTVSASRPLLENS